MSFPERNTEAVKLAATNYWQQLKHDWPTAVPGLVLPGLGNILVFYVPPLIVAKILVAFSNDPHPGASSLLPYVLWFALLCLSRAEVRGMERLYQQAMEYLFARDQAFFNDNFAGSLTEKVVGYGSRYVDVMDTLAFSVTSSLIPV